MKTVLTVLLLTLAGSSIADDLTPLFEKAYFLETAKVQTG